jgi:hypothetical protein
MRLGRLLTRRTRADAGRPLTQHDWILCSRHFAAFEHVERELSTIPLTALNLLLPVGVQDRVARLAWSLDERLMKRFPRLRKHARLTFLLLS